MRLDEEYEENEVEWRKIRAEILGEDSDDDDGSGSESVIGSDSESDSEEEKEAPSQELPSDKKQDGGHQRPHRNRPAPFPTHHPSHHHVQHDLRGLHP